MKNFAFKIEEFQLNNFFQPIRTKVDYVRVVIYAAQLIQSESALIPDGGPELRIIVDKMSRIFIYNEKKYFSISFPLSVYVHEGAIMSVKSASGIELNSKNISFALSFLRNEKFITRPSTSEFYIDSDPDESIGLQLIEELFTTEPSYIRYDIDHKNVNGTVHPLIHFDLNFSNSGTYKLGLNEEIERRKFEDMLDISTACPYVVHK